MKILLIILFSLITTISYAQNPQVINKAIANLPSSDLIKSSPQVIVVENHPVGYQPLIVWLPEGASMGVSAVVSADRRYVRIGFGRGSLMFSSISRVDTFNWTTGESKRTK